MMKKLLTLGLVLLATSVFAEHKSISFMAVPYIQITNTVFLTNMVSVQALAGSSNVTGIVYTNNFNTRVVVADGSAPSTVNLLKPYVQLPSTKVSTLTITNAAGSGEGVPSDFIGCIYIRVAGGANADQAITFTFAPIPNEGANDITVSGNLITVAVTPAGATEVQSLTPVSAYSVAGCRGLMLVHAKQAADNQATTQVGIYECSFNYWE